jgi:hypothetical protein
VPSANSACPTRLEPTMVRRFLRWLPQDSHGLQFGGFDWGFALNASCRVAPIRTADTSECTSRSNLRRLVRHARALQRSSELSFGSEQTRARRQRLSPARSGTRTADLRIRSTQLVTANRLSVAARAKRSDAQPRARYPWFHAESTRQQADAIGQGPAPNAAPLSPFKPFRIQKSSTLAFRSFSPKRSDQS